MGRRGATYTRYLQGGAAPGAGGSVLFYLPQYRFTQPVFLRRPLVELVGFAFIFVGSAASARGPRLRVEGAAVATGGSSVSGVVALGLRLLRFGASSEGAVTVSVVVSTVFLGGASTVALLRRFRPRVVAGLAVLLF